MKQSRILLMAAVSWSLLMTTNARAQETNAPKTVLEAFEAQTGTIIVKGSEPTGWVSAEAGIVSVKCKESREVSTGRKVHGIAIEVKASETQFDTTIIDYDELDSFLNAIDFISKANYTVTALASFDALYTTRGGLRLALYSSNKRPGTLQAMMQSSSISKTRVLLSAQQLAQFQALVQQAKAKLDSLRANK